MAGDATSAHAAKRLYRLCRRERARVELRTRRALSSATIARMWRHRKHVRLEGVGGVGEPGAMGPAGLALSYPEYQRLRRDLEQRAGSFDPTATWSSAAVVALLHALIGDLDTAWSGVEVADAYIESPEEFVVLYRAMYVDGPLAIRGRKNLRGAYVAGARTPQEFGDQFALYLEEPSGPESFTEPDENGLRWFVDLSDDEQS